MTAFPETYKLGVTLASLKLRFADQRRMAQTAVRAVAGTKVDDATLAAVVVGVSRGFGSGEGP
jgi:hypothetical protein